MTAVRTADVRDTAFLRQARREDLASLIALDRRCFGPRAWPVRGWWGVVSGDDWITTVLTVSAELVGASVLALDRPEAALASLAVDPAWRRRGLATALIEDALARARANGMLRLSLEVDLGNAGARRLYAGLGFGLVRRFREGGEWRVEMVKRLRRPALGNAGRT